MLCRLESRDAKESHHFVPPRMECKRCFYAVTVRGDTDYYSNFILSYEKISSKGVTTDLPWRKSTLNIFLTNQLSLIEFCVPIAGISDHEATGYLQFKAQGRRDFFLLQPISVTCYLWPNLGKPFQIAHQANREKTCLRPILTITNPFYLVTL